MIPMVCTIRIDRRDGRRHRIWIPLILMWPFIIALVAIAELLVLVGCAAVLFIRPREVLKIALVVPTILYLLCQAAGLRVDFAEPDHLKVLVELS